MADVQLPQLGESVTEGIITAWLVNPGDTVTVDQPIVEISTDKVDTEIPSPVAGTVAELRAAVDETVQVGQVIAVITADDHAEPAPTTAAPAAAAAAPAAPTPAPAPAPATAPATAPVAAKAATPRTESHRRERTSDHDVDVIVIGGGTGGYSTALRAAQLGLEVALVERAKVGGTCLHWGCIPSKALLQTAEVAESAHEAGDFGVALDAASIRIDVAKMNAHKDGVVDRMWKGLQ